MSLQQECAAPSDSRNVVTEDELTTPAVHYAAAAALCTPPEADTLVGDAPFEAHVQSVLSSLGQAQARVAGEAAAEACALGAKMRLWAAVLTAVLGALKNTCSAPDVRAALEALHANVFEQWLPRQGEVWMTATEEAASDAKQESHRLHDVMTALQTEFEHEKQAFRDALTQAQSAAAHAEADVRAAQQSAAASEAHVQELQARVAALQQQLAEAQQALAVSKQAEAAATAAATRAATVTAQQAPAHAFASTYAGAQQAASMDDLRVSHEAYATPGGAHWAEESMSGPDRSGVAAAQPPVAPTLAPAPPVAPVAKAAYSGGGSGAARRPGSASAVRSAVTPTASSSRRFGAPTSAARPTSASAAKRQPSAASAPGLIPAPARPATNTGGGRSTVPLPVEAGGTSAGMPGAPTSAAAPRPLQPKYLTVRVLHDFMDSLYSSKVRYDAKSVAQHLPRETLEAHLYTFLNQRYGLRHLILESAASVINTVNALADVDNDVAVFRRILRNEIDEDFRLVQSQLKDTARELLFLQLRTAAAMASGGTASLTAVTEPDVSRAARAKLGVWAAPDYVPSSPASTHASHPSSPSSRGLESSGGPTGSGITREEWTAIVAYMYNQADAAILLRRLQDAAVRRTIAHASAFTPTHVLAKLPSLDGMPVHISGTSFLSNPVSLDVSLARDETFQAYVQRLAEEDVDNTLAVHNPDYRLPWASVLHILLDFQLEGHEKFLSKFRRLFREKDTSASGIVSPAQLQMMITTIAPYKSEEEVAHMLATVDPFGHGRITFSECVGLLSADLAASLTVAGPAADALMRLPSQLTDTYPQASLLAGGLEMLASGNMASSFREPPPGGAAAASAPTSLARTPSYAGRHASGGPTAGGGSTALPRSASSASTRGASASRTTGRATPSFRSR